MTLKELLQNRITSDVAVNCGDEGAMLRYEPESGKHLTDDYQFILENEGAEVVEMCASSTRTLIVYIKEG